jgi:hypothetical protein
LIEVRPLRPHFVDDALAAAKAFAQDSREPWTFTVAEELAGFTSLLPIRAKSPSGQRLLIAAQTPDRLIVVAARPAADARSIARRVRSIPFCIATLARDFGPEMLEFLGDFQPITAVEWIEHDFYRLTAANGTLVAFAQFADSNALQFLALGLAIGEPERARARAPVIIDAFPIDGPARVIWGGSTMWSNGHHLSRTQRYALDLEALGTNDHVLAPVAGTVIHAVDGEADDLEPGHIRRSLHPFGNHVVIGCGERHIVVAHLRCGTVAVRAGETLAAGALLGTIGNSGRSAAPHVHLHACEVTAPFHAVPLMLRDLEGTFVELERGRIVTPER